MSTLAERVKQRCQDLGISNAQLAKESNVKPPTAYHWASGKTKTIKAEPLLKAAKALKVNPEWLATGKGPKEPVQGSYGGQATVATSNDGNHAEATNVWHLSPAPDDRQKRLLYLWQQLDDAGKDELLGRIEFFVAGRHPHPDGQALSVAKRK